jgi:hypothetical protein
MNEEKINNPNISYKETNKNCIVKMILKKSKKIIRRLNKKIP